MDNTSGINVCAAIDQMAAIKKQIENLQADYDKYSAAVLEEAERKMADTKIKSVEFKTGNGNSATVTIADTVKNCAPSLFRKIFGGAYSDMVKEETTYKLSANAKRLIASLWHQEYCKNITVQSVVNSIRCSEDVRNALLKKLKGANYDSDVKQLQAMAGLDYEDASYAAYMVNEASAWQRIRSLVELDGSECTDDKITQLQQYIDAAVIVDRTSKIEVVAK